MTIQREHATDQDRDALHDAAGRNDTAAMTPLLISQSVIESRDAQNRTPLLVAARAGHLAALQQLLQAGAAVDARGEAMHITPLMAAAGRGDTKMVRLLLEAGADPNAAGRNGAGALARAVLSGNQEAVRLLLDAGANPNGVGLAAPPNTAPLWAAVAQKRRDIAELLLKHGAQVNIGNSVTDTLFGIAVSGGDAAIARMLLEAGADPLRPALANLPLQAVSLRFSNPPMAELLEEYGLSLAKTDEAA